MPLFPRHTAHRIRAAFADMRVVLIAGPRQAGKTTLAQRIAIEEGLAFLTLDNATTLVAQSDPVGFLRGIDRAVIDEYSGPPNCCWRSRKVSIPTPGRVGSCSLAPPI